MDTLKKTASPAQLAANRRNAQNSTGPRSEGGKAQSRLNALKHGLTAQILILPTEDAEAFEARRQEWRESYEARGPAAIMFMDRAVHASWRLDRCARAETARLATRVLHAADDFERDALDRAETIGRRLIYDPIDTHYCSKLQPHEIAAYEQRRTDHPAVLKRALEASAHGVDWLLARWQELEHSLTTFGNWNISQSYVAARLLGRRPEDATDDPIVALMILNMVRTQEPDRVDASLYDAFARARRLEPNRPIDDSRIAALMSLLPPTVAEAQTNLRAFMSSEVTRLLDLKSSYLDALAASDRAAAVDAAHFDDSAASVLLRRYETACVREMRRALNDLSPSARPEVKADPPSNGVAETAKVAEVQSPATPQTAVPIPSRNEPKSTPPPSTIARRMVDDSPSGEIGCIDQRWNHRA